MEDPLAPALDALFQASPSALVEARNALADRLRKAGDKAAAARVKALKRPAPAAWALNQVHFQTPALLEGARAATDAVRALHARDAVDPRTLLAAHEAQRSATQAVVEAALAHCTQAGLGTSGPMQRRVLATLQALLTGAGDEVAGRLTRELEPGGFDAIESVGLPPARAPREATSAAPRPGTGAAKSFPGTPLAGAQPIAPEAAEAAGRERALARLTQCERELREAQAIAHKRRSAAQRSQRERDEAHAALSEAERTLAQLRAQRDAREADFQAANASLAEAEAALHQREQQVTEARGALAQA